MEKSSEKRADLPPALERHLRHHSVRLAMAKYIETRDEAQAAKAGGMRRPAFCELLADPAITAYVEEELRRVELEARTSAVETLLDLRRAADMALGKAPVRKVVINDGVPESYDVIETDLKAAKALLELLGKRHGMFVDRAEVTHRLPQIELYMGHADVVAEQQPEEDYEWLK